MYVNLKHPLHLALSEDEVDIALMLLDAGAATGWVDFHNVLAVHKEQPIPNAMALLATEPRLKDKWHTFLEKNQAREERSKNMSAMDLLPYINVKAGDQVCRSIEGVWVRGVVVQRHSAKIRVQITSMGPASEATMRYFERAGYLSPQRWYEDRDWGRC